jgi:hypothetical protein
MLELIPILIGLSISSLSAAVIINLLGYNDLSNAVFRIEIYITEAFSFLAGMLLAIIGLLHTVKKKKVD